MVKSTLSAIAVALAINSVLSVPSAGTSSAGPPSGFAVTSFGVNGSGCPPGSASYFIDDKTGLNVVYSNLYAEAGPGISISENRKNCQLTLGVRVPTGFSFALASTQGSGYYYLDSAVSAGQETLYYFQGSLSQGNASHKLVGPVPGAYYNYDSDFPISTFSACGANTVLNIATSIRASNAQNTKGSGYIATDTTKVLFTQLFNIAWQTC